MLRAGQRCELAGTGYVVVVEVRLEDVRDAEIVLRGLLQVHVDVPARVHDGGNAVRVVGDEGADVPKALDDELAQMHHGEDSAPVGGGRPGRC
jgi:hypothetical protein